MLPSHRLTHELSDAQWKALRETFDRIGDRRSLYILGQLQDGPVRFNQLKRKFSGVSQRMLSLALRGLERDGLVTRMVFPTNPPPLNTRSPRLDRRCWGRFWRSSSGRRSIGKASKPRAKSSTAMEAGAANPIAKMRNVKAAKHNSPPKWFGGLLHGAT